MRQLNNIQSIVFILGGILMVAGVGLFVFGVVPKVASIIFLAGTIMFAAMQIMQGYEGTSVTIRRLRKIMVIADIAFVVAGLLMFENGWHVLYSNMVYGSDGIPNIEMHLDYMKYVNNNWVVALLIAAILEFYSINRISSELKKQGQNTEKRLKE